MGNRFSAVFFTNIQWLTRGISLSVLVKDIASAVLYRLNEPRTRAIIVFNDRSCSFRTQFCGNLCPLLAIRLHEIRYFEVKISMSPFAIIGDIGSRVCGDMNFRFLPFRLFNFKGKWSYFQDFCQVTNARWGEDGSYTGGRKIFFRKNGC